MFEKPSSRSAQNDLDTVMGSEIRASQIDSELVTARKELLKAKEDAAQLLASIERFKEQSRTLEGVELASVSQQVAQKEAQREGVLELIGIIEAQIQSKGHLHDDLEHRSEEAEAAFRQKLN